MRAITYAQARRRPADRSGDARAPRGRRESRRRHACRLAARRARPHDHADGRAAAAVVAAAAAGRARAASRIGSTRSRSSRFAPPSAASSASAEGGARPRAAGGARRARHRRPARSRRPEARRSALPRVRLLLGELQAPLVRSLLAELDDLADVRDAIERDARRRTAGAGARRRRRSATASTPSSTSCATISRSGKQVIAEMEERERARTGIASLKVRFNRVFGYYIEISKVEPARASRPTTSASRRSPAASASSRRR